VQDQQKQEIIRSINDARKEIGLSDYPAGYLEERDIEELKKLFSQYYQMREEFRTRQQQNKPRIFNTLDMVLMSISAISFVSLFFTFLL
jgi:hypothetical protein